MDESAAIAGSGNPLKSCQGKNILKKPIRLPIHPAPHPFLFVFRKMPV